MGDVGRVQTQYTGTSELTNLQSSSEYRTVDSAVDSSRTYLRNNRFGQFHCKVSLLFFFAMSSVTRRSSRMLTYVGYRMRVTLQDSRSLIGTFMAFDKHMNMVLGDCEEYRRLKNKKGSGLSEEKEEKRTLGLIILRGDAVVSLSIEGPPPPEQSDKMTPGGPGNGKAMGRGMPSVPLTGAPVGLSGSILPPGMGAPPPGMMPNRGPIPPGR